MHPRNFQVLFLLLFLTHIDSICHILDVRPGMLSSNFLSTGLYVSVLPVSILWIVLSILQKEQSGYFSIWCDSLAELNFKKFPPSFEVLFCYFDSCIPTVIYFFPFFILTFFMPNSIPISWLYMLIIYIRASNYFSVFVNSFIPCI